MINMIAPLTFTGPISPEARRRAEQWCKQQATPQKGEQVRLNTLSVSFVNFYLKCMGFETDLEASDSWNPVQQTLLDVADLELKNIGKLECRPVLEGTEIVYVPPEVESNRIGYLAVQISQSFREASLLGFVKEVSSEELLISQLQPLESLPEYLEELRRVKFGELASQLSASRKALVNLQQWFENSFEAGWQSIENLLDTEEANLALNLRNAPEASVEGAKLIDLGIELTGEAIVLVVAIAPENEQEMNITVEVRPSSGQTYLPPNLQLMVLDDLEAPVMEAETRNTNSYIQLQFSGCVRERFSVKVALGDATVIENFVI